MPAWNGNEFLLPDGRRPAIRTFTPRRVDPDALELDRRDRRPRRWASRRSGRRRPSPATPRRSPDPAAATPSTPTRPPSCSPVTRPRSPRSASCSKCCPRRRRCRCTSRSRTPTRGSRCPPHPRATVAWCELPPARRRRRARRRRPRRRARRRHAGVGRRRSRGGAAHPPPSVRGPRAAARARRRCAATGSTAAPATPTTPTDRGVACADDRDAALGVALRPDRARPGRAPARGAAVNVADLRRIARRRFPRGVFDYIDGGAEDERTLAANTAAFAGIEFRPRVLRDVERGRSVDDAARPPAADPARARTHRLHRASPIPHGELAVARAAARAGLPYTLSTLSTRSIEEVAAVSARTEVVPGLRVAGPRPGQGDDRPRRRGAATRRSCSPSTPRCSAGASATCAAASRCRPRSGSHPRSTARVHPGWTWQLRPRRADPVRQRHRARGRRRHRRRSRSPTTSTRSSIRALSWTRRRVDLRSIWNGPIVIKGIQTVADAPHRGRRRRRRDRALEPRWPPARRRAGDHRPRRAGARRGRRRGSRSSATAASAAASDIVKAVALGARRVHGRPRVPLRARRGGEAGRGPRARDARRRRPAHDGADRRPVDRRSHRDSSSDLTVSGSARRKHPSAGPRSRAA